MAFNLGFSSKYLEIQIILKEKDLNRLAGGRPSGYI